MTLEGSEEFLENMSPPSAFLCLSPPLSERDYYFNLDDSEGICDLYDMLPVWQLNFSFISLCVDCLSGMFVWLRGWQHPCFLGRVLHSVFAHFRACHFLLWNCGGYGKDIFTCAKSNTGGRDSTYFQALWLLEDTLFLSAFFFFLLEKFLVDGLLRWTWKWVVLSEEAIERNAGVETTLFK